MLTSICFFACNDTSVLFCNKACHQFLLEQGLEEASAKTVLSVVHKLPSHEEFSIGTMICCLFSTAPSLQASPLCPDQELLLIYESILNQVEEAVVVSDHENNVIFINHAAEAIEGVDARKSLGKNMRDLYIPPENGPFKNSHAAVLNTGIAPHEHLNQYVVKESHKVMNVVERMFPVNVHGRTIAVFSLIKNLPIMKKSMEQSLELYTCFKEEGPHNGTRYNFNSIVGNDIVFVKAISDAKHVAQNRTTVLIYGETGTGKELFAQSIHNFSPFQNGPFISVNCAAIPSTLLESMFFGTVKGAYTGAVNTAGLLEQAQDGTLFLDEINSMDMALQAKLLKVIENKTIRRIGDDRERDIRCRILCALNEAPLACIENGKLRRDLYYRLSSCILYIPPLRSRRSDIPLLCSFFLKGFNREYGQTIQKISENLMERFMMYPWPGNVRELQHVIESAYSVSDHEAHILQLEHLAYYYREIFAASSSDQDFSAPVISEDDKPSYTSTSSFPTLKDCMDSYEKNLLVTALCSHGNNISATAKSLGITRQALQHKLKKYRL